MQNVLIGKLMFWKNKIKNAKKGELNNLEKSVIKYLISSLPEQQSLLIKERCPKFVTSDEQDIAYFY